MRKDERVGDRLGDVRRSLVASRRDGLPFGRAWDAALKSVAWTGSHESRDEQWALEATKPAWKRAYEYVPQDACEYAALAIAEAADSIAAL